MTSNTLPTSVEDFQQILRTICSTADYIERGAAILADIASHRHVEKVVQKHCNPGDLYETQPETVTIALKALGGRYVSFNIGIERKWACFTIVSTDTASIVKFIKSLAKLGKYNMKVDTLVATSKELAAA